MTRRCSDGTSSKTSPQKRVQQPIRIPGIKLMRNSFTLKELKFSQLASVPTSLQETSIAMDPLSCCQADAKATFG